MENLRIYAATYNVGTTSPAKEKELADLLSIKLDGKNEKLPDFYVLSFQEVKAQPQNILMDTLFEDPWTEAARKLLMVRGYVKIKSIRLQGLLLMVFSLRSHLLNIRDLESEYTRTGLAGMWGNKGAVSIRLSIYGCSICFVNAHLSAHDNQLNERIEDYNSIIDDQEFHVHETAKILYHDYVFWMGDLNFRLVEEYDKSPEEIEAIVKEDYKKLLPYDQLRVKMEKKQVFNGFVEQDLCFPPTFKFEVGTSKYDYKRRPAWCDRILHCVNSKNYENVTLEVTQRSYKSHPRYELSDHKPVSAEFDIKIPKKPEQRGVKVFSDYNENVIAFDPIPHWNEDEDNLASYKITKEKPDTKDDWIGIFKEDFASLEEYVTYEYVSKCSSPSEGEGGFDYQRRPTKFDVKFSELPNRCRGKYCLIYFSQTENKVMSVLGISNTFSIVKNDSD